MTKAQIIDQIIEKKNEELEVVREKFNSIEKERDQKYFETIQGYFGGEFTLEDVYIIGFNPLTPEQDWDGRLVTESFDGDSKSWLICFDGNPIVNGKELSRWDYSQLEDRHYDVTINDGCIGVFTKKFGPFSK